MPMNSMNAVPHQPATANSAHSRNSGTVCALFPRSKPSIDIAIAPISGRRRKPNGQKDRTSRAGPPS